MFLKLHPSVQSLKEKSASILDVFTRTKDELNAVNNQIQQLAEQKTAEKSKIEADLAMLHQQKDENNRVINKIQKIFEP